MHTVGRGGRAGAKDNRRRRLKQKKWGRRGVSVPRRRTRRKQQKMATAGRGMSFDSGKKTLFRPLGLVQYIPKAEQGGIFRMPAQKLAGASPSVKVINLVSFSSREGYRLCTPAAY